MFFSKLKKNIKKKEGFSLIDVLVGVSLALIVFWGIFGGYHLVLKVIGQSKARIIATALANQKIEEIRNLSYGQIGTVGGYPDGLIEEEETLSRNSIDYTITTDIKYGINCLDGVGVSVDDCPPGADDSCPEAPCPDDDCPNDYKKVKVTVSWATRFGGDVIIEALVSPKTSEQECQEVGGFLLVSVFDAIGGSVNYPEINVENIDTSQTWQAVPESGKYTFVLPEDIDAYKISVSKTDYSQARTYAIGESYGGRVIAVPDSPHSSVFESDFTEKSFSIDQLGYFNIFTLSPQGAESFLDSFVDNSKVSETNQVNISGEEVNLAEIEGVYFEGGTNDDDLCSFPGTVGDCGQSFTTGDLAKQISSIELYLEKANPSPSNIYLEIRSGSTIGTIEGTSNAIDSSALPDSLDWISFSLTSPVNLQANTQYFLRLRSLPDSGDPGSGAQGQIRWGFASGDPYPKGSSWRYIAKDNNPSDSGEELLDDDFSFKVHEDEYHSSGYLISEGISPTDLVSWEEFIWSDYEPAAGQISYQVIYETITGWELIPDSDLPGNSIGFSDSSVNLTGLDISDYSSLKLKGNFITSDPSKTPTLYDWQVAWVTSASFPIGNVTFDLRGDKTVGKDESEDLIYKHSDTHTTDASGQLTLSSMEWDSYHFSNFSAGLDLVRSEPEQPVNLSPGANTDVELYLEAENSLLVEVNDISSGEPVFSAQVRVYNGLDIAQLTNLDGQTIFIPLGTGLYQLEVQADGFQNYSGSVTVSGDETKIVNLTPN